MRDLVKSHVKIRVFGHLPTTRSQALTRIAHRTASQQIIISSNYIAKYHLQLFLRFCTKCIGMTSLTFWGHVTSSVTWPFDSP